MPGTATPGGYCPGCPQARQQAAQGVCGAALGERLTDLHFVAITISQQRAHALVEQGARQLAGQTDTPPCRFRDAAGAVVRDSARELFTAAATGLSDRVLLH